jgi:hypothetical protein
MARVFGRGGQVVKTAAKAANLPCVNPVVILMTKSVTFAFAAGDFLEGVFVFGTLGNVVSGLGSGWSIESEFAWTIGRDSTLTLALPGDDRSYTLRFDLHPAVFPGTLESQVLTVSIGDTAIATFELSGRREIMVPLPPDATLGRPEIELRLHHPLAARPCDHGPSEDQRPLGFCFHTGTLALRRAGDAASSHAKDAGLLEPVHGLIAGGAMANLVGEIVGKLPSLRGRFGLRVIDFATPPRQRIVELPPGTLDSASFCWIDNRAGLPEDRDAMRAMLPDTCRKLTFLTPHLRCLWPLLASDPRSRAEPGRYGDARYPQGDRLAMPLATANMPDDVVYLMYDMAVEKEALDLDGAFAREIRAMRQEEAAADIRVAGFIQNNLSSHRLFLTPYLPGARLILEMTRGILDLPEVHMVADAATVHRELDALLEGFVPWDVELPIHARVARHFDLRWWRPDMRYRWFNNHRTHRQYMLDYIRWVPWRV